MTKKTHFAILWFVTCKGDIMAQQRMKAYSGRDWGADFAYYIGEDSDGRTDTYVFNYKPNPKLDASENFDKCVDEFFSGASETLGFPCSRDLAAKLGCTEQEIDDWLCGG